MKFNARPPFRPRPRAGCPRQRLPRNPPPLPPGFFLILAVVVLQIRDLMFRFVNLEIIPGSAADRHHSTHKEDGKKIAGALPGPVSGAAVSGAFVVLSSGIHVYLLILSMKKGSDFSSGPGGVVPLFLPSHKNTARSLVWTVSLRKIGSPLLNFIMIPLYTVASDEGNTCGRRRVTEAATGSPKSILKAAYKTGMISDEQLWLEALATRNNVAHAYNSAIALQIVRDTKSKYYNMFCKLDEELTNRI